MSVKKKISGFSFLLLVGLPYLLLLIFIIKQQYIKWEKSQELKSARLQTVVIPVSSVVWFEQDKELILCDKLFDVAQFSERGGMLTATGIFDTDETDLLKKIHKISARHKKQAAQSQAFLALLLTGYLPSSLHLSFESSTSNLIHSEKPSPLYQSCYLPLFAPPPQC